MYGRYIFLVIIFYFFVINIQEVFADSSSPCVKYVAEIGSDRMEYMLPDEPGIYRIVWKDIHKKAKFNLTGDVEFTSYDRSERLYRGDLFRLVMIKRWTYDFRNHKWVCTSSSLGNIKFEIIDFPKQGDDGFDLVYFNGASAPNACGSPPAGMAPPPPDGNGTCRGNPSVNDSSPNLDSGKPECPQLPLN